MPSFEVSSSDGVPVRVQSGNWLSALGDGLEAMGLVARLERLACEVLPNGRVVARDVRTGQGYVVEPLDLPGSRQGRAPLPPRSSSEGTEDPPSQEIFLAPPDEEEPVLDEDTRDGASQAHGELAGELFTDPWPVPGRGESPSSSTARVVELVDRVRRSPSSLLAWHEALDSAQVMVPSEAGAALEREEDGRLRFLYAFGPRSSGVQGAVLPAGTGIAGFSVQRVASLLVTDTRADPRFCADFDQVTGFQTHAVICVPVAYEGRVFGCLELLNPVLPGGYDRAQLELVEMVADALADRLAGEP